MLVVLSLIRQPVCYRHHLQQNLFSGRERAWILSAESGAFVDPGGEIIRNHAYEPGSKSLCVQATKHHDYVHLQQLIRSRPPMTLH
jgi:hypothetical protein